MKFFYFTFIAVKIIFQYIMYYYFKNVNNFLEPIMCKNKGVISVLNFRGRLQFV